VGWAVWAGIGGARGPERCGEGLVALGPRCCGEGQRLGPGQRCEGPPRRCGALHRRTDAGCEPVQERITYAGGSLRIGPSDWEAQGVVEAREITVGPFWLDRLEAHAGAHAACVAAGACPGPAPDEDPARAALLTLPEAEAYCRWRGGRLPTEDEWVFAAMGPKARRYPWGDTGAVCRRAAYGLTAGPCAAGATGPDTVGAHPAGASPEGAQDLAGNAPEWARQARGSAVLRGGSYRSALAAELRGWSGAAPSEGRGGARCAGGAENEALPGGGSR
jgi:formylglycine-generating enzyme required for sulfatase activity